MSLQLFPENKMNISGASPAELHAGVLLNYAGLHCAHLPFRSFAIHSSISWFVLFLYWEQFLLLLKHMSGPVKVASWLVGQSEHWFPLWSPAYKYFRQAAHYAVVRNTRVGKEAKKPLCSSPFISHGASLTMKTPMTPSHWHLLFVLNEGPPAAVSHFRIHSLLTDLSVYMHSTTWSGTHVFKMA